jgi:carboxyl-terminal processing protease
MLGGPEVNMRAAARRLSMKGAVVLAVWGVTGLRPTHAATGMAGLKLVAEVRDKIHRYYVDEVDSVRVVDGAIDGMVAVLPEGENVYVSPAEIGALLPGSPRGPALDNIQQVELLAEAFEQVSRGYLEPVSVDTLSQGAVWGMLAVLDPHSSYLDAQGYEEMVERFRGDFEGVGINFDIRAGKLLVISPILGSPAYGRLRAGDHIVEIDGVSTEDITSEQVMKKLRGSKGTQVEVRVRRPGVKELLGFTLQRDRIMVHSVPYAYVLRPGVGYVRVTRFAENTGSELSQALQRLQAQGVRRLLLDLRDNGGGLLSQAVEVADYFIDQGELLVYTQGREAGSRREYRDQNPIRGRPFSLVVLIDHGSASAAEIVAGAVQDLDLGLVVGQTSFGKGLVQEQFPLTTNGGLLLLTVARYYTPLGRSIQRPYSEDIHAYIEEGLEDSADSLQADRQVYYTAMGRPVYGGGGITPDIRLVAEPLSEFAEQVGNSGVLFEFGGRWVGGQRRWSGDFAGFQERFEVPAAALTTFREMLRARGIAAKDEVFAAHRVYLQRELKAEIARVLWGDEQYYRIHSEGDREVAQALGQFGRADSLLQAQLARRSARY